MNIQEIYLVTQSVQAIMLSIFFIALMIFLIKLSFAIRAVRNKITTAADSSIEAAEEAKGYVGKIGRTLLDYLAIKAFSGIKRKK